ncbi:hypothetical protein AVEN_210026-1 [Araneus ventricosus]|uniref:Uncharacterized protein n=1 Tax=Araneus ventricosus TaxID=182803 RepID=A0A4Y2R3L9_ARAVE|nr:hypothetical protein AVEN_210026-1 [Araneus ventricosus]
MLRLILYLYPSFLRLVYLREPCSGFSPGGRAVVILKFRFEATRRLFRKDLVILKSSQTTRTTPEMAPFSPNFRTTPSRSPDHEMLRKGVDFYFRTTPSLSPDHEMLRKGVDFYFRTTPSLSLDHEMLLKGVAFYSRTVFFHVMQTIKVI